MVYEARKQSMAWMETMELEHLGALGIMGETHVHQRYFLQISF